MRRELAEHGRRCVLPRRNAREANSFRGRAYVSRVYPSARHYRSAGAESGLRSYQVQNHPEPGDYRALIGHKRGADRPPDGASTSKNPGFLGIRAVRGPAKMKNERGNINRMDISHKCLKGPCEISVKSLCNDLETTGARQQQGENRIRCTSNVAKPQHVHRLGRLIGRGARLGLDSVRPVSRPPRGG